ncbi:MAG TPA: hypothetical protein VFO37_02310 [Chitinophagaceae bacterium]|nr:hypothetical protein [Chitinophagaceae bacterium]
MATKSIDKDLVIDFLSIFRNSIEELIRTPGFNPSEIKSIKSTLIMMMTSAAVKAACENQTAAARLLGCSRGTVMSLMKESKNEEPKA